MKADWQVSTVGAVCEVIAGQSPKGSAYNDNGDGLPFYQGKKHFGEIYIREPTTWTREVTKEATRGDILMSVRAPVGPVNFATQKSCIGRGLAAIRPGDQIDPMYLFYWFLSKQDEIKGNEGAVFASINKKQIEKIELLVPPLLEQKRIVGILDEAFAGIATAIANTEKNLANAFELFESYLGKSFTELDQICPSVSLSSHIKFIDYRGRTPKKTESGLRLITAKNVRPGNLQLEPEEFVEPDSYDAWMTRGIPKEGDVLFTTEAPLGFVCSLDISEKVVFAQRIITMQPDRDVLNPRYLEFGLRSQLLQKRIHANATGATATGIKSSLLKKIEMPLAPMTVQMELAERMKVLQEEVKRLEDQYRQKLNSLDELKQSLLQKAFSGELTADRAGREVETATA